MASIHHKQPARYYWTHHFVFYPLVALLSGISLYELAWSCEKTLWIVINGILLLLTLLALMVRQHYALGNQDRIIRLEMRLRYYVLTHKRFEEIEGRLSEKQVFALRFASDEELEPLIHKTIENNLSPADIKKLIRYWQQDNKRL